MRSIIVFLALLVAFVAANGCKAARDSSALSEEVPGSAPAAFPLGLFKTYCESCHGRFGNPSFFPDMFTDNPDKVRIGHENAITRSATTIYRALDWGEDALFRGYIAKNPAKPSRVARHPVPAFAQLAAHPEHRDIMMKALEPHTDPKLMAIPLVLFRSYCEECHSNYLNRYGDDPDLVQRQGIAAFAPKIFERLSYESIDAGKGGPGVRAMPAGDKTVVPNEARAAMLNGVLPFLAEPRPTPLKADDLKSY